MSVEESPNSLTVSYFARELRLVEPKLTGELGVGES